jgi:hypothetical protein
MGLEEKTQLSDLITKVRSNPNGYGDNRIYNFVESMLVKAFTLGTKENS